MFMLRYTNVTEFRFAVVLNSASAPIKITKFEVTTSEPMSGCMTGGGFGTLPDRVGSDPVEPSNGGSDPGKHSGLGIGMISLIIIAGLVVLAGIGFVMHKCGASK